MRRSLFLFLLFIPLLVFSQGKNISGKVVDSAGEPLPGVSILIEGTTQGTVSDINGVFVLENVPENANLVFSFIGFENQVVSATGKTVFNVALAESSIGLNEVVAVGYGVQKKSDVTGAMVSVSSTELTSRPVANAFEAMQGKAAGVDITSNERPGEIGKVLIRGVRSLLATNDPLYVVDGVTLMSPSAIETINPLDIESVDVLKDASATAIYGSRGANGVIIVTTKRGKSGSFQLNYSGTVTIENIVDKAPAMSASDYITWRRWAYYNSAPTSYPRGDEPTSGNDFNNLFNSDETSRANVMKGWESGTWDGSKVTNTDWTDFVTQTAITQEHTLSASGGTEKMKAYISFGYLDNQGTMKGQSYERYNTSLNVDIEPKKWFAMGGSINTTWSEQEYGYSRTGQASSSGPTSIYEAAKQIGNFAVPYDEQGNIVLYPGNMGGNGSVSTVIDEWKKSNDQRQVFRALGSFYANVDFGEIYPLVKGLKFKLNFGPDFRNFRQGIYIDKTSAVRAGNGTSYASLSNRRDFSWTFDKMITYDKEINNHNIGVTLLHTASKWNYETSGMHESNVPKSSYLWNNMGAVDITATENSVGINSYIEDRQLESYMARMNYSYMDKYLLTASGRWDGASMLAEGHQWDFFPSLALGWRIDQEGFMDNVSAIDQLKLRLGVGTTGNSAVAPYSTLGGIQSFYVPFGTGGGNTLAYATNEPYYTSTQVTMANPVLGWEKTTQYNLGVDFSILKGRLNGTIDAYRSFTSDLLLPMNISTVTGYGSTYANVGKTSNQGVDITLNAVPVRMGDFEWSMNVNAAWQKDEIEELAYGKNDDISNLWLIGESLNIFYGYENDGLWQESDAEEMALFNANGHTFSAGSVKPVDQDGNNIINQEDRVVLGNENPSWTMGVTNTFSYKNIELSFMVYGRMGYMISTGGEAQMGMFQQRDIDYWTPNNTDAEWQKPVYSTSGGDAFSSLLGFRDASFLKLRNVSLGYKIPSVICKKIGIQNAKVYVQAKNVGTLYSSVDWIDLDLGGSTFNRGFVFGINVGF